MSSTHFHKDNNILTSSFLSFWSKELWPSRAQIICWGERTVTHFFLYNESTCKKRKRNSEGKDKKRWNLLSGFQIESLALIDAIYTPCVSFPRTFSSSWGLQMNLLLIHFMAFGGPPVDKYYTWKKSFCYAKVFTCEVYSCLQLLWNTYFKRWSNGWIVMHRSLDMW